MAHPDLDQLLNTAINFAQQMLAKRGEFYPFGCSMNEDGQVVLNAAITGAEQQTAAEAISMMTEAFKRSAASREIRAAAICSDMLTVPPGKTEKTDAICVSLEHEHGEAVDVCLPYKKGWLKKITYGQIFAAKRTKTFFV